ncbi:MAG: O-antigen ligase family protein [Chlorobia bacterium]|nr:O-antigen ligase family protein [Fimbriimonadaceae bacterium]
MAVKEIKTYTAPQVMLSIAAFLIPIIGGQISTDQAQPLGPGFGSLIKSILGGPFTQGMETPIFSHLAIGLLVAAAMAISLAQRSVIQLPNIKLTGAMVGFFGLLFISVGLSEFRFVSMATLGEWLLYALTFFTAVAVLGRNDGPKLILGSLFVGVSVLALCGIGVEYQEMRALDPSYRIFAGWVNPNATAGIFLSGLVIGLGLIPSLQRGAALLAGVGCSLICVALFLTGSKAGFGAAIVGVVTFAILVLAWSSVPGVRLKRVAMALGTLAIGFGLFTAIQKANQPTSSNSTNPVLGRLSSFGDTQAQSLGFRKLLWKGSLHLSLKHPTGYGLGTYRYEGSRPGLTTQTQLAHNNVLQLAVEASWLAVLLLFAALWFWISLTFRAARSMPDETNMLRAGIVAAVVGTFAHGMFESNLYYFGIGLTFFLLMGVALCLSADSVAPEFTPKGARLGLGIMTALPILMLSYFGLAEYRRTQIQYATQNRDFGAAKEVAEGLVAFAPLDGEAWNTLHLLDPSRRGEAIRQAASVSPSPRILRSLARYEASKEKYASAESAIRAALVRDPNNLNSLKLGLETALKFADETQAKYYAERMLAVEGTDYYKIRSLPQMVETSTSDARIYLASQSAEAKQKVALLQGALDTLVQYATLTVPEVKKMSAGGSSFGGESPEKAIKICNTGITVAKQLRDLYQSMGERDKSTAAGGTVADFEAALESLGGSK